MNFWTLIIIEVVVCVGISLIAIYLLTPKIAHNWAIWKKSGKSTYLSTSIAAGFTTFVLLTGVFFRFIHAIWGL